MTDEQIRIAAGRCQYLAFGVALGFAVDVDLSATVTAILVEALKQATPELSAQGRQRLFEEQE